MFYIRNNSPASRNTFAMVLMSVLFCVLFIESRAMDPTQSSDTKSNSSSYESSTYDGPPNVYNPVNNIQITTCDYTHNETLECTANCSSCDKLLPMAKAQLHMTSLVLKRLNDVCDNKPVVQPSPPTHTHFPRDCAEVKAAGFNTSGRYAIYPEDDEDPLFVFCDMDTSGGGWTVFQRRKDGSVDFYLNWLDYKYGFGSVEAEHWLGNEKIHRITSQKTYKLRVDLEDFEGQTRYAEYDQFIVADEDTGYQLILGEYQGTAGDSLSYHDGWKFTTKDRDNDGLSSNQCAQTYKGAWWYNACHYSNLNGLYLRGPNTVYVEGINWETWRGWEYSLKTTEMKIYPLS